MDWSLYSALSEQWCKEGEEYVDIINEYRTKASKSVDTRLPNPPNDPRTKLANQVIEVIREANKAGETQRLRELFPPSYEPFFGWIQIERQSPIHPLFYIDEHRICLGRGGYGKRQMYLLEGNQVKQLEGILSVGRSADRKFYVYAYEDRLEITVGWLGEKVTTLYWPANLDGPEEEKTVEHGNSAPQIDKLIVYPDGKRVLLQTDVGIFVIGPQKALRVHPSKEYMEECMEECMEDMMEDGEDEPYFVYIDMGHVDLSPDGAYIAVGDQCSNHRILDESFQEVASIRPLSEYPHYAMFNADGSQVMFNSCHFYHGGTFAISMEHLPLEDFIPYTLNGKGIKSEVVLLDENSRVYAGIAYGERYIFGNAYGSIMACTTDGRFLWEHWLGGTISGMDISVDGTKLVVSSYAETVYLLDLDTGDIDPYTIGVSSNREIRRWLFWEDGDQPLVW